MSTLKPVIFTDLDGTLLDLKTYSYDKALPSINYLREQGIPVVFCSAKTRAEQEVYRQQLKINDPFIVENGGAIFISQGYFPFDFRHHKFEDGYQVIELGIPYQQIRQTLEQVRSDNKVNIKGFGDMSAEEVASLTGLDLEAARRAKTREYDETLTLEGTQEEIDRALKAIGEAGLNYTSGGRFYDATGPNDKGKATKILSDLFRRKLGPMKTMGIGDSPNDLPMLSVVDIPVLVQKPGAVWQEVDMPHLRKVVGIGPEGWARAIEEIIKTGTS
ncbi:mannosyl-3-phosphoglycerate phosphatase [Chloroflexota bacterium]